MAKLGIHVKGTVCKVQSIVHAAKNMNAKIDVEDFGLTCESSKIQATQ